MLFAESFFFFAEDDMRELLKRSVRSGRTAMTSVVMSLIRSGKT